MGTEQTFLRDGKWLTVAQIKEYNKKKSKVQEPVEASVKEDAPVVAEKPKKITKK